MAETRKAYITDVSDEQWALIGPELERLTPPKGHGPTRTVSLREVFNTIQYQARTGCQWALLPHDLLPKSTVYEYFAMWRDNGTFDRINAMLVGTVRTSIDPAKEVHPTAGSIDSKTVPSTQACEDRGYDGGKKIRGRKRNIAVDTLGLLLAVSVTLASVDDAEAARSLVPQLDDTAQPRLEVMWADNKYHNYALYDHLEGHPKVHWRLEIVRRPTGVKGFVLLPKRWVVERTFAWQDRYRRLSKDYERRASSAEAWVKVTSITRMLRYLKPSPDQRPYGYREKPGSRAIGVQIV